MTTLIYARLIAPPAARAAHNPLVLEQRVFLQWPQPQAVWAEVRSTLGQFARQAVPIFVLITLVASVLEWLGALAVAEQALTPLMSLFNLPAHTALAVVMGSIRKDGLVLFAEGGLAQQLSSIQLLTGVYLAGVLLPCFVTVLTIAREQSWRRRCRCFCPAAGLGWSLDAWRITQEPP